MEWKDEWVQVWKPVKKQVWVKQKQGKGIKDEGIQQNLTTFLNLKYLEVWKEEKIQIWRTEKKQEWANEKKLIWKEEIKEEKVPAWVEKYEIKIIQKKPLLIFVKLTGK